jgi:hypothetical protein
MSCLRNDLGFSPDRVSSGREYIDDLGDRGSLFIKEHRGLIKDFFHVVNEVVGDNALRYFQDKPYPVARISSPEGKGDGHLEQNLFQRCFSGSKRGRQSQQKAEAQEKKNNKS